MKKYNKEEWDLEKDKLANEINAIPTSQFSLDDAKAKIKRKIPKNCSNKNETKEAIDDLQRKGNFYMGGSKLSENNDIKKYKEALIDIVNDIELMADEGKLNDSVKQPSLTTTSVQIINNSQINTNSQDVSISNNINTEKKENWFKRNVKYFYYFGGSIALIYAFYQFIKFYLW